MKKTIALLLAVMLTIPAIICSAAADNGDISKLESSRSAENGYSNWLSESGAAAQGEVITLGGDTAATGKDENSREYTEWQVTPAVSSRYYIKLTYKIKDETRDNVEVGISVDNKYQYKELEQVKLEREYYDVTEPTEDYKGNQVRPEQAESRNSICNYLYDYAYEYSEPLSVALTAGNTHKLRITSLLCSAEIGKAELVPTGNIATYKEWLAAKKQSGAKEAGGTVFLEGEDYSLKSATTVYPISDNKSAATSPQKPGKVLLNTVGGYHWNSVGQYIIWKINAPEDGLYKVCMRVRQNTAPGQTSSRALYINGDIPYEEAKAFSFKYDASWQTVTLGDGMYVYLNKGENEIKLQNTLGEMDAVLRLLNNSVDIFNGIYNKLLPVLGASPDLMRDYRIGKLYPELVQSLKEQAEVLAAAADWIESYCGKGNSGAALIRSFVRQLNNMHSDPDKIPKEYSYFKTNIGSLSTWIGNAAKQPLEIDSLTFGNDSSEYPAKAGFFKQLIFGINSYLYSYVTDYETIGTKEKTDKKEALTVWVGQGREQAQIIRNMAAKSFTPKTGTAVNVKNVAVSSLMMATVAGIGPDLVVVSSPDVFNFAMRNAAYPVSDFSDFNEVAARFAPAALIPVKYCDKYYGLPEHIDFSMLFYRKDILQQVGISKPETWDDLISASSVLSNNNMEIGLPSAADSFLLMLKQAGLNIYEDGGKYSVLDSVGSINVFTEFTNFYVSYGFPLSYDVVNRFRSGEMPIAIASVATYNSLQVSAPEINGLWEMDMLPGTLRGDGSIDRSALVTVGTAMILSDTDKPEKAWEFLKWWTETEQQVTYADEIESVLGKSSRYNSANLKALEQSNWSSEQKQKILAQVNMLGAVEPVPGGYYLARNINNAFRNVVYNDASPTDALYEYTYKINAEIDKKRKEFGLELRQVAKSEK